jgi:TIR domain
MAYNVFISYSTKNLHIVDWARATLAQPGITEVFAAEYSVLPSQVLNAEIIRAIRACDLFVRRATAPSLGFRGFASRLAFPARDLQ